jgi:tetratricopeptide (TPR) repeat protein
MTDLERALEQALGAVAAQPASPQAHARAGAVLAAMGRAQEALRHLDRALTLNPALPDALNNRGAVLRGLDRLDEALACFEGALTLAPEYADARYNLAGTLVKRERYIEAIPHYERLLALNPDSAENHGAYGKLLWKSGRLDEAIASFERAIALNPAYADVRADLGNALTEAGRIDRAVAELESAIELAPDRADFYRFLTETRPSAITAAHVSALEHILGDAAPSDDNRIEANFALGNLYASAGDRARSFEHLLRANEAKRRFIAYDERDTLESFRHIAETFNATFLETRRGCSVESALPIFIFGMPRSGTTLIEQVLASHPSVFAAGELTQFEDATNAVLGAAGPIRPDAMVAASCERLREIGARYVEALTKLAPSEASRVTDKMPANVRFAGLIHTILPNARMIHARRNPVDTCISIFSRHFAGEQPWAYDLGELGRYYRAYERLSRHWRAVLPADAMLEVNYEDVVDGLEAQARRIVAFCGLDWDPACLEFYKTERQVKTASATQVRRPIYRTSVNRARDYGDLLKPLLDALE